MRAQTHGRVYYCDVNLHNVLSFLVSDFAFSCARNVVYWIANVLCYRATQMQISRLSALLPYCACVMDRPLHFHLSHGAEQQDCASVGDYLAVLDVAVIYANL